MIRFAKSVLTDLYIVQKEEFSTTRYMCDTYTWRKAKHIYIRDKPIFSSERMLHKDCDRNNSVGKRMCVVVILKTIDSKMKLSF
jgi:hypothetical protein